MKRTGLVGQSAAWTFTTVIAETARASSVLRTDIVSTSDGCFGEIYPYTLARGRTNSLYRRGGLPGGTQRTPRQVERLVRAPPCAGPVQAWRAQRLLVPA